MASDDTTSQDSMVIGDELVEALGFELIADDEVDDIPSATQAQEEPASGADPASDAVDTGAVPDVEHVDDVDRTGIWHGRPAADTGSSDEPARDVVGVAADNEESSIEMATNDTDTDIDRGVASVEADTANDADTDVDKGVASVEAGTDGADSRGPGVIDLTSRSIPAPPTEADLVTLAPRVDSVPVIEFEPIGFESAGAEARSIDPVVPMAPPSIGGVRLPGLALPTGPERHEAPMALGLGQRRQRLRARKTRRVVRHVDPWSMLTFSVIFHLCFFAAMLLASVLVWNAAIAAGTIENIESFVRELGDYERFEIDSAQVFTAAVLIAGMLTLASTIMLVLLTVVFNLISDLVGGIRVTVIEEETVRVPSRAGGNDGTSQVVGGDRNR
jgi:hypothetical protein